MTTLYDWEDRPDSLSPYERRQVIACYVVVVALLVLTALLVWP